MNFVDNRADLSKLGPDISAVRSRVTQKWDEAMRRQTNLVPDLRSEARRVEGVERGCRADSLGRDRAAVREERPADRRDHRGEGERDRSEVGRRRHGTHDSGDDDSRSPLQRAPFQRGSESMLRFGRLDLPQAVPGYKPRPLKGSLGDNRNTGHEFRAGYVPFDESKPADAQLQGGAIGAALLPDQRMEIIEYLKIHRDAPDEQARTGPDCLALLQGK